MKSIWWGGLSDHPLVQLFRGFAYPRGVRGPRGIGEVHVSGYHAGVVLCRVRGVPAPGWGWGVGVQPILTATECEQGVRSTV